MLFVTNFSADHRPHQVYSEKLDEMVAIKFTCTSTPDEGGVPHKMNTVFNITLGYLECLS